MKNEVFYLNKDMHEAHDALMCIGSKTYLNEKFNFFICISMIFFEPISTIGYLYFL